MQRPKAGVCWCVLARRKEARGECKGRESERNRDNGVGAGGDPVASCRPQ